MFIFPAGGYFVHETLATIFCALSQSLIVCSSLEGAGLGVLREGRLNLRAWDF